MPPHPYEPLLVSGGGPSSCRVTGLRDELMLEASGTGETSAPRPNLGQSDATAASTKGPEGQDALEEFITETLDASALTRSAGATPHPRKQAAPPGEMEIHRHATFPEIFSMWKKDTHQDWMNLVEGVECTLQRSKIIVITPS